MAQLAKAGVMLDENVSSLMPKRELQRDDFVPQGGQEQLGAMPKQQHTKGRRCRCQKPTLEADENGLLHQPCPWVLQRRIQETPVFQY